MSKNLEKWQQRYPKQRMKFIVWRSFLALSVILLLFFQPNITSSNIVSAEDSKRTTYQSRLTMANHWRFFRWNDGVSLCNIYVAHENYPNGDEIRSYCGDDLLVTWLTTPACEEALFGKDVSECEGVYIGYLGKSFQSVKELVELPQVDLKVEMVNCEAGGWCNERAILRFVAEEPLTDHRITSVTVKIGTSEKKCDDSVCELRMPITNEAGVEVEYWAISDYGDESERETFTLRNVPDLGKGDMYRFDLLGDGIDVNTPAGTKLWSLFPVLNHPDRDTLEQPASYLDLSTENRFLYLAGKLILTGIVDGKSCAGFGLINNNTANPCGEDLAFNDVMAWQNQYDQEIYNTAIKYRVPARLIKGIIAQETQFWPYPVSDKEYGLGRITENGADMLLIWNNDRYLEACLSLLAAETCAAGYSNLDAGDRSLLRGLVLSEIGTENEIDLLGATFLASATQVTQMVKNITELPVNEVSTYEEMWKISVANYHSGSGCVGTAMQTAWSNGDNMYWDSIYPNLLGDCMGAVDYVESVYELAN
ncbi:MAG TPA: hypothetical protein VK856_05695 [Anaerolineaceae bacterium]|nr:hypothetical protein [Anaerolineaceae bacterium]